MSRHSEIQWCDSTVNPTTGCDGCELWKVLEPYGEPPRKMGGPCYAGNLQEQRLSKSLPNLYAADFTEVRLAPGRMAKAASWTDLRGELRPDKPWLGTMPRVIFVGDLGDIFSRAVPFEYLEAELIDVATGKAGSRHIWMTLTKQPWRMVKFAEWLRERGKPWPANVWPGVSITGPASLSRIDALGKMPASVRYLSVEPQVDAVDLRQFVATGARPLEYSGRGRLLGESLLDDRPPFDLVILGGESGQGKYQARPYDLRWPRSIIAGMPPEKVKVFVKQLGSRPIESEPDDGPEWPVVLEHDNAGNIVPRLRDHHGGDWSEWPEDLRVREFPEALP